MKKILILFVGLGLIAFSNNITGPRYRVDLAVGAINYKESLIVNNLLSLPVSIGFLPEWKYQINNKIDLTFGPKINLVITNNLNIDQEIRKNLILGGEIDFNYRLKENIRIYSGIEVGTGLGITINDGKFSSIESVNISKISIGVKISDEYNVAFYTGDIKGLIGIEAGCTF